MKPIKQKKYNHLFGPIPSRRLGISLGVDLVPYKTCSMNCIYCECGQTTQQTLERKEYVPTLSVIAELDHFLRSRPDLDVITFSGAGEPTLASNLGTIIKHLKTNYPHYAVVVLTNASLLDQKTVRAELRPADIVSPSLDAASSDVFTMIDAPHPRLHIQTIIKGLIRFRQEYSGQLWLEIFILPGINDAHRELEKIKAAIQKIQPDKIQLNTLDRPGLSTQLVKASLEQLQQIAHFFQPFYTEIVSGRKDVDLTLKRHGKS